MTAFATATRASGLYSTARWRAVRAAHLAGEPHCRTCKQQEGRITLATVADHVDPPHGDDALFWSTPLQSLCRLHSNRKTALEVALRQGRQVHSPRPKEQHPGYVR